MFNAFYQGSKYCLGSVEGLIAMDSSEEDAISVKVRGPRNFEKECFFFLEEILGIIDQVCMFM